MRNLPITLIALTAAAFAPITMQQEALLKESDHKKIGKEIADCIEAFQEGKGRIKAEEKLSESHSHVSEHKMHNYGYWTNPRTI